LAILLRSREDNSPINLVLLPEQLQALDELWARLSDPDVSSEDQSNLIHDVTSKLILQVYDRAPGKELENPVLVSAIILSIDPSGSFHPTGQISSMLASLQWLMRASVARRIKDEPNSKEIECVNGLPSLYFADAH
jgi:hypothetical protein